MPLLILAVVTFIGSALLGANVGPSLGPFLNQPQYAPISSVCLDESVARTGIGAVGNVPAELTGVKRPEKTDFVNLGWIHPQCKGSTDSCSSHPAIADYVLVATKVKVNPVIFSNSWIGGSTPSDRQMMRLNDAYTSSIPSPQVQLKGRLFRTFCGDWCCGSPGTTCRIRGGQLPYMGSFHCDFLFYLEDTDEKGNEQIDASGNLIKPNSADPNLPENGSLFSIYFRKGADIPPKVACTAPTPVTGLGRFLSEGKLDAYAQSQQSGFPWPPHSGDEWLYRRDGNIKSTEVNPDLIPFIDPDTQDNLVVDPLDGMPGEFRVYKNLSYPSTEEILYLVPKDKADSLVVPLVTATPTPLPLPTFTGPMGAEIPFKEFHLLKVVQPKGVRSLQLGTFFPPQAADWVKEWYEESKPAIYLYPRKDTVLSVKLNPSGILTFSDPPYLEPDGWHDFIAHPDGTITYKNMEYPHLYYEARLPAFPIDSEGFVVKGSELVTFFRDILPKVGLEGREIDEFIGYWMGRLNVNQPYYFIRFLSEETIKKIEPLTISIQPDVSIRIRAYFKPLDASISVTTQSLPIPPIRKGFVLVEWGGILDE